jgi:hypothetical protein
VVPVHVQEPEPAPEYEFEPVVDYAPVGEHEPETVPDEVPLPEYELVFEAAAEPEFQPEPLPSPAALQRVSEFDPESIERLIVRHDLAVADAYFDAVSGESAAPDPPPVRCEPGGDNLSSALLDASLVALAAVLATRLLKSGG